MRILDRERYWAFFKAFVICFVSLVGLYIVIDAFTNFDEFVEVTESTGPLLRHMGRYYLVRVSLFFDRLCGVITMMAAIFTVTWLQRNNELLAMLAAGVSAQRVVRPVLVGAVFVSAAAAANQELIIPRISDELQRTPDDDGVRKVKVSMRRDVNAIEVRGESGFRAERTVERFEATLPHDRFGRTLTLSGEQARYIPPTDTTSPMRGGWLVRGARIGPGELEVENELLTEIDESDLAKFPPPRGKLEVGGTTYFLKSDATFTAVTRSSDWYLFAPSVDLLRVLGEPNETPEMVPVGVALHARIIRPFLSLTLLALSLPLVLGGEGRNMFINLGLSLGTSAVFYGVTFMAQYLGNNPGRNNVLSPTMAAWLPLFLFGTIAVARWDSIRT